MTEHEDKDSSTIWTKEKTIFLNLTVSNILVYTVLYNCKYTMYFTSLVKKYIYLHTDHDKH